jgi:DcaP outer membrane protein
MGRYSCFSLAFVLLISGIVPACVCAQSQSTSENQTTQELQKELEQLRVQMNKVQAQLEELQTERAASTQTAPVPPPSSGATESTKPPLQGPTSKHVGAATSEQTEFNEDAEAAARYDNVPLDPKYAGFFRLPGTEDILKIGGYFKSDFIEDLKPAGNTDAFVPSSFPVPQVTSVNNNTISVRPTRLSLDFRFPSTTLGEVRFYVEGDFFGTNATTPRLRHAYAQVKNILIGQTFSNFMDPDAFPDTLDFQGPNGMVNIRNPQFRYGFALTQSATLWVSVEKPSSDVIFTTPQFSAKPNSPGPDGTVRIRQEFQRGHIQASAVFRDIAAYLPNGESGSVFGWGVNVSAGVQTHGKDNLIFAVAGGHGVSRYIQDTSGLGIDAEPASAANPHLQATPAIGIEAAYQHFWTPRFRSSIVYSYAAVNDTDLAAAATYNHGTYTAANLIWNPLGSLTVGGEFLYGWTMEQNHLSANAPRIQFSAKYNFIKNRQNK